MMYQFQWVIFFEKFDGVQFQFHVKQGSYGTHSELKLALVDDF
jgi:hypothetical protein